MPNSTLTFEFEGGAPVACPIARGSLLCYLYELASPTVQRERWLSVKPLDDEQLCGLSFVAIFLFEVTDLGEHPEQTIGTILIDELEAAAVRRVGAALRQVYREVGLEKHDSEYVNSQYWRKVVAEARSAYRLLRHRVRAGGNRLTPPLVPR